MGCKEWSRNTRFLLLWSAVTLFVTGSEETACT
jgi:hypothetical protein